MRPEWNSRLGVVISIFRLCGAGTVESKVESMFLRAKDENCKTEARSVFLKIMVSESTAIDDIACLFGYFGIKHLQISERFLL